MKRNYVIIGLGRFGLSLVEELSSFSDEVIAIDLNVEAVKMASNIIQQAYIADSTSEIALKNIGVQNADHVVIAFGENFEGTVMTFATLKELGVKNITVRCDKDTYVPILTKLGVTDMVSPTKLAATRLASRIVTPSFVDYFKLANDFCVVELPVSETFESTKIIDLIFGTPILTVGDMVKALGVTRGQAVRYLHVLEENGILIGDDKQRSRTFRFDKLLDIVNDDV